MTRMRVGDWLDFEVGSVLELPHSDPELVLISDKGVRYLVPFLPYKDYDLVKGRIIRCRVDKINCSGKIFLEPEHPGYKEGHSYTFTFIRKKEYCNVLGQKEYLWIVGDKYNNEIAVRIEPEYYCLETGTSLVCTVTRIKKGKLELSHPYSLKPPDPERLGCWMDLNILPQDLNVNNELYHVLEDPSGEKYLLKSKHYTTYKLKTGMSVHCKFVKWKPGIGWVIEPLHPVYREGEWFPFQVDHIILQNIDDGFIVFQVTDYSGNHIAVEAPWKEKGNLLPGRQVMLKILEVRKGKPVFEWTGVY